MQCFKGELGRWCDLRGPSSNVWRVQISRTRDATSFLDGWADFVRGHGLVDRNLLEFKYIGPSRFQVSIFDFTMCEIEGAYFTRKSSSSSHLLHRSCSSSLHDPRNDAVVDDVCEDIDDDQGQPHELDISLGPFDHQELSAKTSKWRFDHENDNDGDNYDSSIEVTATGNDSNSKGKTTARPSTRRKETRESAKQRQTCYVSNRRGVTNKEKLNVLDLAASFMRKNRLIGMPMFQITLLPTHVHNGFHLTIPRQWALEYMDPTKHDVELQVPGVKGSWTVGCRWNKNSSPYCQLRPGWPVFVLENNLEEHDVCVFQLIKKRMTGTKENTIFNVHVFRVVKECVPLTVIRGLR